MSSLGLMVKRIGGSCGQDHFGSSYRSALGLVSLLALSLVLMVFAGPAGAAVPPEFGHEGEKAGEFHEPRGIAIDQASGDVFVADLENQRVDRFGAEGEFTLAWGWGVADGQTAALQTCEATCFQGLFGPGAGEFHNPGGIAVDNSANPTLHGDVYVGDPGNLRVEKFSPDGQFLLMFGGEVNSATHGDVCTAAEAASCQAGVEGPGSGSFQAIGHTAVATEPSGSVYVGDLERVQRFSAEGVFEGETPLLGAGVVESLAVDSAGDLYVMASGLGVHKYDAAGVELGEPRDPTGNPFGAAITIGPGDDLLVYDQTLSHVLEYDPSGAQIGSFVEGGGPMGLAYDQPAKAVYIAHREEEQRGASIRTLVLPPPGPVVLTASEHAEEVLPTSATLSASVNPEESASTDGELKYHFDYGQTPSYGTSTAPQSSPGAAFEDRPVTTPVTGLQPSTLYHFRVVVENAAKQVTVGPDQTFTTAPPVSVESESASQVTSSSVRLQATLNAHGLPSEFHFDYGPTAAYGKTAPEPDASAGSSSAPVDIGVLIEGLSPATTYHYRVVATNSLGTTPGLDQVFTTQGPVSTSLIDGRGWEQVSPTNKHGVALEAIANEGALIQAAADGSKITYVALGPLSGEAAGSRSIFNTQLFSTREGTLWGTRDITTPHEEITGATAGQLTEYLSFSTDLSSGVVEPFGATPLAPPLMGAHGERTPYRRESNGQYTPLVTASNTPAGTKFGGEEHAPGTFSRGVTFDGMSPDGSHIVLGSPTALVDGFATEGESSLYEWSGGKLHMVSVLPDGKAAGEEGQSSALGNESLQVRSAVSADGTRIVFATSEGHLFLRDTASGVSGETVQLDVPTTGTINPGSGEALFQQANVDGSRVFFTDEARLTPDATARPERRDLYVCDVRTVGGGLSCALKDLTVDSHAGEVANVLGDVIGVGDAGRFVYFAANGVLAAGAVPGDCTVLIAPREASSAQTCNLYVRDTQAERTSLVAVVSNRDAVDFISEKGAYLGQMTSRVSPDGRWFAFMSTRSLTGYDSRDVASGQPDAEVFEYHAAGDPEHEAGSLSCVSCDPTGARPSGMLDPESANPLVDRKGAWQGQWVAALLPGWTGIDRGGASRYQSRYLSDSGRLFFNSVGPLVPSDANGRTDVYEFEPSGVGSCGDGSGCVALLSQGSSAEESVFLDASESGDDVFFLSAAKLAPQDADNALDVYDAHVCSTAVPCPAPQAAEPPACSTADSCRAAPAPQPDLFGAPASATFHGAGNLPPPASPAAKPLTRAQLLARALHTCRAKHNRHKRSVCEAAARRRYGAKRTSQSKRASHAKRASYVSSQKGGRR